MVNTFLEVPEILVFSRATQSVFTISKLQNFKLFPNL